MTVNGTAAWSLHRENLGLRDRLNTMRQQLRRYETELIRKEAKGHCVYCGAPARRNVCHAHSDLPGLDDGAPR